jgi:hypothetical protein
MIKDIIALIREPGLSGEMALYTFPPLGILGALVLLSLKQYQYLILSIYMIVPIICAPLAYMLARGNDRSDGLAGDAVLKFLVASYLICFAFSLTLLYAFDVRPVLYYFVIAAMATLILVHTYYMNSLTELGHVTSIFFDYQSFPLWHIMNAGIYLAGGAGFPAYKVMAIVGGLAFATLPVVIYLIAMRLFKDYRVALVAALITILFPDLVAMAACSIPRIIAEILMVFLVYLLLIREGEHDKRELRGAALDNAKFLIEPEGGRFTYIGRNLSVWGTLAGYSCVYDSKGIRAYT